jgi:decaprenylphospho-beta-D-ribofuranose 2-oxidase
LKKVYSGKLDVTATAVRNWDEAFDVFVKQSAESDYLVGWIDCMAGGAQTGRGLIHSASYKARGADPHPEESLRADAQKLPETAFGFSRSGLHRVLKPFVNRLGMRFINSVKYRLARREHRRKYEVSLAKFNFLLDSIPNWRLAFRPGGLIQYQCFVPSEAAPTVFDEITRLSRERGLPAHLGVMKRHRSDRFLLSHAVDGYSLALDYRVTTKNRDWLWRLCESMDDFVLDAGGRFYFAKDSTLTPAHTMRFLGDETIRQFAEMKHRLDPQGLLQSELSKRTMPSL